MQIFKDEESEQGFNRLRADYDLICSINGQVVTNLVTKNIDTLIDYIDSSIQFCLTEEFLEASDKASAGNLDELLEYVDQIKKELETNG